MPEAVQGGVSVFWREMGSGGEPVLLLHCGLGQSGMWKGVAAELASRARMIAPDLPDHGRSGPFPEGCDVIEAAARAMQPFVAPGTHLAGHSFGAVVALCLALERPRDVASLTLIEPVFFAAAQGAPEHARHRARERALFETCEDGDGMAMAEGFNALWGGGVPWGRFPPETQAGMARQMPFVRATEAGLWEDRLDMLRPGALEALTCPVRLVRGSATVPIIADVHAGLRARLPWASDTVIDGAAHMLVTSHAKPVAAEIACALEMARGRALDPVDSPAG